MRCHGDLSRDTRAMLADMLARGPLPTDEVDPTINRRTMCNRLERLRAMGYLSSVKMHKINMCVWTVTERGRLAIVDAPTPANVAAPRTCAFAGNYTPEWMPVLRPHAHDAFLKPSVGLPT